MKTPHPLFIGLTGLISISIIAGLIFESLSIVIDYSTTFYLLFCLISAIHFLEENYYKAWKLKDDIFGGGGIESHVKLPEMDRNLFILFSHCIVIANFLFYFPISTGASWAMIYGLGVTLFFGMLNGVAHFLIYLKLKKNTGMITGTLQLITGILVWFSFLFP